VLPSTNMAEPCGRAVKGVGLRLLASWDCGFESPPGDMGVSHLRILCVVRSMGVGLITRLEECCRMSCV